jgi:arylsulfatase A-like enzyme
MRPPHIIFIITDQQRADTIGAWGHPHMHTPNMDRLAAGGCSFRSCHAAGATCTPSRAALFTGMYAHNTGCYSFNQWSHHRSWVQDLADAGYYCANMGKMHIMPRDEKGGFHERVIVENPTSTSTDGGHGDDAWGWHLARHGMKRPNFRNRTDPEWERKYQGVPWEWEEHLHSDVFTADSAVTWIEHQGDDARPTFLEIGFPGPHEPWDPLPRHVALYDGKEASFPDPIDFPRDFERAPPQHEVLRATHANTASEAQINMPGATREDVRRMQKHYYAKISLVDEQMGRVLDALEKKGMLANSVVIFTSDHGEMLGDHGMSYKWLMYDCVTNVPLIVRDFRAPAKPAEVRDLVSLIDVGPMVCDYAGLARPSRFEGRSLRPYVDGGAIAPRRHVFCEDSYLLMMRSDRRKLVYYHGQPECGELYDLENDPHEMRNLWTAADHATVRQEMLNELFAWLGSSCYHNWGYKTNAPVDYGVRWPRKDDLRLHGPNYAPKLVEYF